MTTERLDTLIDALVDLDLRGADLEELAALVRADDRSAARLEGALQAERTLRRGAAGAEAVAARVPMAPCPATPARVRRPRRRRLALGASWALTAASLALAASLAARTAAPAHHTDDGLLITDAARRSGADPGVALGSRQILGELPLLPVGVRQGSAGKVEVVYVRPQIEQAEVADIYRLARDEHGRPVPVRSGLYAAAGRQAM